MSQDKKIKKTVVFVGYECNNNCQFCMEQDVRHQKGQDTQAIMKELISAKKRGSTYIELIGGEITIRPDFLELVRFAKKVGFETVMIATNGRMFSYKKYAFKAIEAGLNSVVFSIHGHDYKTHDSLTQASGSFDQLHAGLKNIKEAISSLNKKVHLGTNTTVVNQNYKKLPELGEHIKELGIKNSEFIFVDCNEGGAYNDFNKLVPKISDAAPYIKKCLDLVEVEKYKTNWDIRYVPLCYFLDNLNQVSELREIKTFQTEQVGRGAKDGYTYQQKRKNISRIKPEKCKKCILYDFCEGIWKNYYQKFGDKELLPVSSLTKSQKNKLNF